MRLLKPLRVKKHVTIKFDKLILLIIMNSGLFHTAQKIKFSIKDFFSK